MKFTIKNGGELTMDLWEILDGLSDEDKQIAREMLAIDTTLMDSVIAHLTGNQFGMDSYHGSSGWLTGLREKVLTLLPDIERLVLKEALLQRDASKADAEAWSAWGWNYWRAVTNCPECQEKNCGAHRWPKTPEGLQYNAPTQEEVDAFIAECRAKVEGVAS